MNDYDMDPIIPSSSYETLTPKVDDDDYDDVIVGGGGGEFLSDNTASQAQTAIGFESYEILQAPTEGVRRVERRVRIQDNGTGSGGGGGGGDGVDFVNNAFQSNEKSSNLTNEPVTFREGVGKKVDFILVFDPAKDNSPEKRAMRESYEENLQDFGIEIEREESPKETFIKLHCPFIALCRGAELLKLKKPINRKPTEIDQSNKLCSCFPSDTRTSKVEICSPFVFKNSNNFRIEKEDEFFSSADRSYIVYSLLERTIFRKNKDDPVKTGLSRLIGLKAYSAAYPLHESIADPPTLEVNNMNDREWLYHDWVKPKNLFKPQPLDRIKSYFGEQFTFYFAWMGLYTIFLSFASVVGLACFFYGLITTFSDLDIPTKDVCDKNRSPGNFTICPKCDKSCTFTILSDGCNYARFTRIFDNEATLVCAIFITVWGIAFIEFWKRRQAFLQQSWSVKDFEADEIIRPQYYDQAKMLKINPLSGEIESIVSPVSKCLRFLVSISTILFFLIAILIAIFAIIVYRLAVVYALYSSRDEGTKRNAKLVTTFTAACLNVLVISVLSVVYKWVAKVLTDLEAHKTRTSYEDSFIFKMIVFQFINNYGSIIYIAFFKGSFVDKPGMKSLYMFGMYKQDECDENGCFSELTVQLIIIMIGKQLINAIIETFKPMFMKLIRSRDNKDKSQYKPWERDLDLEAHPPVFMYEEYLEMVIQYGFVVMFVAAFPLAPLFAFINNLAEIRLDAYKMIKLFRRFPAMKAQDIGTWHQSIKAFSHFAVITNAFIIAWTSDFIPKLVYKSQHNHSLDGYVEWSLANFNASDFKDDQKPDFLIYPTAYNVTECKYRTYSPPPEQVITTFVSYYWQILCARWAFVIVFEHVCYFIMTITRLIPDESEESKQRHRFERAVTDSTNVDDLFERVKTRKSILIPNISKLFTVDDELVHAL